MFIQTEATPNPATLKFLPGREVLPGEPRDFRDAEAAAVSPLASALFALPGVTGVFLGSDFISVTKDITEWNHIKPAVLGAIMEPTSALVLSVPILLPVAQGVGVDPIHFGVITVMTLMIGLLTPPVGPVGFVLSSVTGIPVREVFRGFLPFMVPLIVVVLLIVFFPVLIWTPTL